MKNRGVDFQHTNFAGIAAAFGGHGVRVTSKTELETALRDAQSADTFTLIAAEIDRRAYDGAF